MTNGRPPKYKTAEELQKKIDEYFAGGYRKRKHYIKDVVEPIEIPDITITDLCIFLGFCSRQSFYDLGKKKKFSYSINRASLFIEREYEALLKTPGISPAGIIFALKNFRWSDKQEISATFAGDPNNPIKHQHKWEIEFI